MSYVAAGVAAGSLASAAIGSASASSQTDAANAARNQAVGQWLKVNVPDPVQQQIELENYQVTGQLSPQLEQSFQQSNTGLGGISLDPNSRGAEVDALNQMQNLAKSGGLDPQSEMMEQQALNKAKTAEQGQRAAIVQNAMARGQGQGGGAMLAAELQASQGDANQAAATGMTAAADARMRALQAMTQSSQMGAQLNAQDYGQAANAATAQDAINRFNTQNSQNVANANVTNANAAQAANLANKQSVANANTGVANQQETANKGLIQQQFNNQSAKAAGASGQYAGVAQQANQNATNTANMWSGIGQSLSKGLGAYGQYANNKSDSSADSDSGAAPNSADPQSVDFVGPEKPMAAGGEVKPSEFEQILAMLKQAKGAPSAA